MTVTDPTLAAQPQPKYRKDYRPPAFLVDQVELDFDLGEEGTVVDARLAVRRNPDGDPGAPLVLDGEELETLRVALDGEELGPDRRSIDSESLTVADVPDAFTLETRVRIHPESNSQLSGLYLSSGNFCTQCEAEGFRRITWFPDRPDVMARYRVSITADAERYPVLLSNGNRLGVEPVEGGRHRARWEDPFPKPSYLFALVAGDLHCHPGTFTTKSGREVRLEIWVEHQDADKAEHALRSLQKSMDWDERTFGLEYDLDLYMIVAVGDFNMGAMENKGLNVFNSKYVLARPDTATDSDYEHIEGVIAHEYFHNWTGNRVTCRDWFQLTLKEGLTVYRDQRFTQDVTSEAVKRVDDVRRLRLHQMVEDAGPMAHPVRPEQYIEMNNFYTATVYEKGAEVVRMYEALLGRDGFRRGMDLYFERHDGEAVTCDDFRAAMADANGRDLDQFERWYRQKGTPRLVARGTWNEGEGAYALTLRQEAPANNEDWEPCHVPVRVGLVGPDGADLPLAMEDDDGAPTERVLELTERETTFVFTGIGARPVPSVLRGFSAPVRLELERTRDDLAFLLANDSDAFNRWDAGQALYEAVLLEMSERAAAGDEPRLDSRVVDAVRSVLADATLDGSSKSQALGLPPEEILAQRGETFDPGALFAARRAARAQLGEALASEWRATYDAARPAGPYSADRASIDARRLAATALAYLGATGSDDAVALAKDQFDGADNMTDAQAALAVLAQLDVPAREEAFDAFHARWKDEPLVLDKWFSLQATSTLPGAPARVRGLLGHPDFTLKNPNRVRALVGAFALANFGGFHEAGGAGYDLVADVVLDLDPINPQVASRLVRALNTWKRLEPQRSAAMHGALERVIAKDGLSKDVYEIVARALGRV